MSFISNFERDFTKLANDNFLWIARIALFIVFFLFGFLKLIGASPANQLALGFAEHMGAGAVAHEMYYALAVVECAIGLLFLLPRYTVLATVIMLVHMALVSAPIVLYPQAVWSSWFVPNLEGQYIIKNIALVALAIGIVGHQPKSTRKNNLL